MGPRDWNLMFVSVSVCTVFVSVSVSLKRKGPCVTALSGFWARILAGVGGDTNCVYPWSLKNAGHRAMVVPLAFQAITFRQPGPTCWVTQVEIRAERKTQSWAIYGHTPGPPGPHPHPGAGHWFVKSKPCIECQLVCCPFIACSCGKGGGPSSGTAWVSRGSSSFSDFRVDKCSFVEHIG